MFSGGESEPITTVSENKDSAILLKSRYPFKAFNTKSVYFFTN